MSDGAYIDLAANNLLDFAEFYFNLGDLSGIDLLTAIGERNPEFTFYIETLPQPPDNITDFLKLYGEWAVYQLRDQCLPVWDEVKKACVISPKFQILSKQFQNSSALWDMFQEILEK